MKIEKTGFGWIIIDRVKYTSDVIITVNGEIKNRYEDFSGSSHFLSRAEAEKLLAENPEIVIIGTGQSGCLSLPPETEDYLREKRVDFISSPTPEAIEVFNREKRKKSALFHLTC
ncbi:MAG: MTH938/NDUFAF3 family protein [candidate division WOR-3 bacterium]